MREICVPLPGREQSYQILLDVGLRQQLGDRLAEVISGRRLWVVTDTLVGRLYGQEMVDRLNRQGFHVSLLTVPRGERSKSWPVAARLTQQLVDRGSRSGQRSGGPGGRRGGGSHRFCGRHLYAGDSGGPGANHPTGHGGCGHRRQDGHQYPGRQKSSWAPFINPGWCSSTRSFS